MTVRHVLRDIKKSLDKLERKRKETPEQPWAKIRAEADERKTTLIGAAGMNATLLQMQERQMRRAAFASNERVIEVAMRALHPRKKRREEARCYDEHFEQNPIKTTAELRERRKQQKYTQEIITWTERAREHAQAVLMHRATKEERDRIQESMQIEEGSGSLRMKNGSALRGDIGTDERPGTLQRGVEASGKRTRQDEERQVIDRWEQTPWRVVLIYALLVAKQAQPWMNRERKAQTGPQIRQSVGETKGEESITETSKNSTRND